MGRAVSHDAAAYQAAYREANREKRRVYTAQWQAENREAYLAQMYRIGLRRHGLTPESYDDMLAAQGGVCAICGGINASGKRLVVDHDHDSNRRRLLLCGNCNRGIGYLKDNPATLRAAADYIERFAKADDA